MKLALLQTICETPGWQPPAGGATTQQGVKLFELMQEGLIVKRPGGYEATAKALDLLPSLTENEDGNLVRIEREPQSSKPLLQTPLDWNVPQRAVLFLAEEQGHPRREGWALIGGSWLFFYDERKDRWITWSSDQVIRVEWVIHA